MPIRGMLPMMTDAEHQLDRDRASSGVGAEHLRLEHVDRAALGQRPRRLLGLGHVLIADEQGQRTGMPLVDRLGPYAAELPAQAAGEFLAALGHLASGHTERQVEPGQPARAVPLDRVDEDDGGRAVLGEGLVDPADAEAFQGADDDLEATAARTPPARWPR